MPARWPRRQESVAVAESGLRGLPTPRPLRLWRLRSARLAPRSRLGGRGEPEGGPDDGGLAQRRGLQWAAERLRQRCGGEALMKPSEMSPPPLCNRVGAAGCTRGGVATTDMTRKQRNINKMMKTMNTHKPRSTFLHAQSALGGDAPGQGSSSQSDQHPHAQTPAGDGRQRRWQWRARPRVHT